MESIVKIIVARQHKYFELKLINYDPYKCPFRQCNGRCPRQKFDKIKKINR